MIHSLQREKRANATLHTRRYLKMPPGRWVSIVSVQINLSPVIMREWAILFLHLLEFILTSLTPQKITRSVKLFLLRYFPLNKIVSAWFLLVVCHQSMTNCISNWSIQPPKQYVPSSFKRNSEQKYVTNYVWDKVFSRCSDWFWEGIANQADPGTSFIWNKLATAHPNRLADS